MLSIDRLSYSISRQVLISNMHWEARPGDVIHIMGENGAGKSTLLKLIAGFLKPDAGSIDWQGMPLRKKIVPCYLGHALGITEALTVDEHIDWYACLQGVNLVKDQRVEVLRSIGLTAYRDYFPSQLSCGLRQRVALLRFMLSQSPLWLMDEPATGLDAEGRNYLETMIKQFVLTGGIVVLSAHQALLEGESHKLDIKATQGESSLFEGARW